MIIVDMFSVSCIPYKMYDYNIISNISGYILLHTSY